MLDDNERPSDTPDGALPHEPDAYDDVSGIEDEQIDASLTDDLFALFEDGKTYAQAEIAFQKSRGNFAANRTKKAIYLGLGAFGVFHLALIACTLGVVIALAQLVGPWIATAIVTAALLIVGFILLGLLKGRIDEIRNAFSDNTDD